MHLSPLSKFPELFHHTIEKLGHETIISRYPLPLPAKLLVISLLFSVSMNLPFLGASYEWSYTMFVFLYLSISLSICFQGSESPFPFCSWIIFYWMDIPLLVYLFSHWWAFVSSILLLWIMQLFNAGVQGVQVAAFSSFGHIPRSGLLNHMAILCLIFWGTA